MAENKTRPTDQDPEDFLAGLTECRRADSRALIHMMQEATGEPPRMWGPSIIGFGTYHYRYETGREGDFFRVGFAPRKRTLTLYLMPGFEELAEPLSRLGKHELGSSCLHVTRLAAVDRDALQEVISASVAEMDRRYPRA